MPIVTSSVSIPSGPPKPQPIAIVIPWFGAELKGGAEQQAWQIATRLAARGHRVEVLTTCCRSFFDDWAENHLPAGESHEAGLTIRRFPVESRDRAGFDNLNGELLAIPHGSLLPGVSPVKYERAALWTQENINSHALESYLAAHKEDYQAFIFLPYLYGVILRGLPLVAERAWLQPCLHDEAYAYLPDVANIFYQARGLLFISAGEMQLAARLFGPMIFGKGEVAGGGIELDTLSTNHLTDLPSQLVQRRFVLCLGRRDAGKGTDRLVAAFRAFRQSQPATDLHLVLAGPGESSYNDIAQGVIDLGLVSDAAKAALLQSCLALFQPSTNESFSRVLFEAWACGKPVIAHRDCLATAVAVQVSGGGWIAGEQHEWHTRLADINSADASVLATIGAKGRDYASEMADWDKAMVRYEQLLELTTQAMSLSLPSLNGKSIDQLLPDFYYGDAISTEARGIRDWLRAEGYTSDIYALRFNSNSGECKRYDEGLLDDTNCLIYHHSIGNEITCVAAGHQNIKLLIYHNITPAEFFQPYRPDFAPLLRQGREEMFQLAKHFRHSVGDSDYNAEELALYGFAAPGVLPLAIDPGQWNMPPDEHLMQQLQDGNHNILFVGRYAPNKCQHDLVKAFAYYLVIEPNARLILVGSGGAEDPYVQHLQQTIDSLGLREQVLMPGHITDAQLHAYYRSAHLFWCMSEHEGFCVPLIEAMWFDVPILTFSSSAIPGTLSGSGILFKDKSELPVIAGLALKIITDEVLKEAILYQQRHRRLNYLPSAIRPQFMNLVRDLTNSITNHNDKKHA
jgi:glycosyltransferase involved in cell wall biosynthesis